MSNLEFCLNAEDRIYEIHNGLHSINTYWDKKNRKFIVLDEYYVSDGQDDAIGEFEVLAEFDNLTAFIKSKYYDKKELLEYKSQN